MISSRLYGQNSRTKHKTLFVKKTSTNSTMFFDPRKDERYFTCDNIERKRNNDYNITLLLRTETAIILFY